MIVGMITIGICNGDADISVELLGSGPRPGTAWVKALNGLQPFTKISHGGPYQDDTLLIPLVFVRDVHLQKDADEEQDMEFDEDLNPPTPHRYILAPASSARRGEWDWFLESAYTLCAQRPGGREA